MTFDCRESCCKCSVCGLNFGHRLNKSKQLGKHLLTHVKQYSYCAICNQSVISLKRHELKHFPDHPEDWFNEDGNVNQEIGQSKQAKTTINLLAHQKKLLSCNVGHNINRPRYDEHGSQVCSICGKFFSSNTNLNHHFRTHTGEKPFQCQICNKSFAHSSTLNKHKSVHSNEKLYQCDLCGNSFKVLGSLRSHRRKHSGERPYKCDLCDKSFLTKPHLTEHLYVHGKEPPFKCTATDCHYAFRSNYQLQKHLKNHLKNHLKKRTRQKKREGEPKQCNLCGKNFSSVYTLDTHLKKHSGERPYKCDMCDRRFFTKPHLSEHFYVHGKELPFKCTVTDCHYAFRSNYQLQKHLKTHMKKRRMGSQKGKTDKNKSMLT